MTEVPLEKKIKLDMPPSPRLTSSTNGANVPSSPTGVTNDEFQIPADYDGLPHPPSLMLTCRKQLLRPVVTGDPDEYEAWVEQQRALHQSSVLSPSMVAASSPYIPEFASGFSKRLLTIASTRPAHPYSTGT
jgi:hypothetical protein